MRRTAIGPLWLALAAFAAPLGAPAGAGDVADYPHKSVRMSEIGTGPRSYLLFEPADPAPEEAPVVVFVHGWLAMNPGVYGAWIDHLVRRGNVVVYPRFMEPETGVGDYLPNALSAIEDALDVLGTSRSHVRGDRRKFALVGHSTGGVLAVQVAALSRRRGLPEPRAVVAVTPGEVLIGRGPDLADIPARTLLVVVATEHDSLVGDGRARQIYREATSLPASGKRFVLFRTDLRGRPAIWADHVSPTASSPAFDTGDGPFRLIQMGLARTNAIDREGFWKVADATLSAGFDGRTLDDVTAPGGSFVRLGYWSDGHPLIAPIVAGNIDTVPRVVPAHGLRLLPWPDFTPARP